MLRSTLFLTNRRLLLRNGTSPPLRRSLQTRNPLSTRLNTTTTCTPSSSRNESSLSTNTSTPLLEQMEPKLSLTFTCTVSDCGERSTHQFTKRAYQKGVVLVQCPGCKNRHLIADHLGWFKESTQDGKLRTIEDLLKAKGEKVRRGRLDLDGTVEYIE